MFSVAFRTERSNGRAFVNVVDATPETGTYRVLSLSCCFLQTAGFEVLSSIRDISIMGMALTFGAVLLLTGVWAAVKLAGKRFNAEGMVEEKIQIRYIETGEVRTQPSRARTYIAGIGRLYSSSFQRVSPWEAKRFFLPSIAVETFLYF